MSVLFLFLDGVGLGHDDPATNPFSRAALPHLHDLLGGRGLFLERGAIYEEKATLIPTDATLGVEGLPQSATGQAALLTGVNVAERLGHHAGPWPAETLREWLRADNLFLQVSKRGGRPYFANAYPRQYFEALDSGRRRISALPYAAQASGLELLGYEALRAGLAFSVDFTGQAWRDQLGYADIPALTPEQAGAQMARLARRHTLTLYDFWIPDYIGHDRKMDEAIRLLESFDQFLSGILRGWDGERDLLLITSDHGNLEDLGRKTHTYNPVPTLLVGAGHRQVAARIRDLTDIAPALIETLHFSTDPLHT